MACGIHLGILLICLVQAEHVRCLWATQAQSSQRQNGNTYVGFAQQDSGLTRLGPQNRFRQASVSPGSAQSSSSSSSSSSSFRPDPAVNSANWGSSTHGSQPVNSGYSLIRMKSEPKWPATESNLVNSQKKPGTKPFVLSAAVASGASVNRLTKQQNDLTDMSKRGRWPAERGAQRSLISHQARGPGLPAPAKVSTLFTSNTYVPEWSSVRGRTSAVGRARRVSLNREAKAPRPSSLSPSQDTRARTEPSQNEAVDKYKSKLFPASDKKSAPGIQPRSGHVATGQGFQYKPSPMSKGQNPSVWNRGPGQASGSLPASGGSSSSGRGTAPKRYAPTRTFSIPLSYGGSAIRRLRDPVEPKGVGVWKPQQTASLKPQGQAMHAGTQWQRISLPRSQ